MSYTILPAFGSFDYATGGGAYSDGSCTIEDWNDEPSVSRPVTATPRAHISPQIQNYLRERKISFKGTIGTPGGGTYTQLLAIEDAFNWAHRPGYRQLALANPSFGVKGRAINAQVSRKLVTGNPQYGWLNFELEFGCQDPYWYATTADTPVAWTPATGTSTKFIPNAGAAYSRPVFEIIVGATAAFSLTLSTTDPDPLADTFSSITIAYAATISDIIVLDMYNQTLVINGVNAMNTITAGGFFSIGPGGDTVTLVLASGGSDSFQAVNTMRWL